MLWVPLSGLSSCLASVVRWGFPTASSRGRPGWGVWSSGSPAPLSPSHRLTGKTEELRLSWWKPSGLITMTDRTRSAITGEAMPWVQSQWFASPSWKRQGLKHWPPNWAEWTLLHFLYMKVTKSFLLASVKRERKKETIKLNVRVLNY